MTSARVNLKLYMFYVGGSFRNSNIELHDVRFCLGATPQDCYEDLKKQWWGTPSSLHIDSWAEITHADGFDVVLSDKPFEGSEKLYFLNLGGYNSEEFEEAHRNIIVVANTEKAAIQKGIRAQSDWRQPHKDEIVNLENIVSLSKLGNKQGVFVHLQPTTKPKAIKFTAKYIRLNK